MLPIGYTKVDYIETNKTQYIDTNYQLFNYNNHKIVICFEPLELYNYNTLFGSSYDGDTFESWIYSTGQLASRYNNVRYGNDNALTLNEKYLLEVEKDNNTLSKYVNGTLYGNGTVNTKLVEGNFYFFKSGNDFSRLKIYYCKLYSNNVLVRDMIPCVRDSDNKVGMYDLVEGVFYQNAGTGNFTYGRKYGELEIEFDGVLLDPVNYMELKQKWVMFDKEFKLGMTPNREFTLTIPKSVFNINTKEVFIRYKGFEYAYLIVDNYKFEEGSLVPKVKLTLCDKMVLANVNYDASSICPTTCKGILLDICSKIGVELGNKSFLNEDETVNFWDSEVSAREYISYISEVAGGFARIENDGKLWIRYFEDVNTHQLNEALCEKIIIGQPHEVERVVFDNGVLVFKKARASKNLYLNSDTFEGNGSAGWTIGGEIDTVEKKEDSYSVRTISSWAGPGVNLKKLYEEGKIQIGDILTYSVYFKINFIPTRSSTFSLFRGSSNTGVYVGTLNPSEIVKDTWYRLSTTFEVTEYSITSERARIETNYYDNDDKYYFGNNRTNYMWFSQPMVEKGSTLNEYEPSGDLTEYSKLETLYLNPSNVYINTEEQFDNIVSKILGFKYWNLDTGNAYVLPDAMCGDVLYLPYNGSNYYTIQNINELKFLGIWNGGYSLNLESGVQQETKQKGLNTQVKAIKIKQDRDENTLEIAVQDIKTQQDTINPDLRSLISDNTTLIGQTADALRLEASNETKRVNGKFDTVNKDMEDMEGDLKDLIEANTSLIQLTAKAIMESVKTTGGNNLLRNSVGLAGLDFWTKSGTVETKQDTYTEQNTVSGSCFVLTGASTLKQSYITQIGMIYGVSFKIRHIFTGTVNPVYIRLHRTDSDYDEVLVEFDNDGNPVSKSNVEYTQFTSFNIYTYTANVTNPWIEIVNTGDDILEVSDLIISFGENQSWSGYFDEVYGKEHRLDKYGLKLLDLASGNFSYLTSTGIIFNENGNIMGQLDKNLVKSASGEFTNSYKVRGLNVVALDDDNIVEYRN